VASVRDLAIPTSQTLVYHERDPSEHRDLVQAIKASVRTDEHRQEVDVMSRTIADAMREEGEVRGLRRVLLDMMRKRFRKVPPETARAVKATNDIEQLNQWLHRFATTSTLEEVGIAPPE
jgi:hypothetical protein